ncbi:MAG: EamA family transporter [Magnetococcales bacterium]|nr:EamA family transporter [Magnetococcales bacterium]MBF0321821.1 EamA family transporter [Magnetococcales bacterium]
MSWFFLAILTAVAEAAKDILGKQTHQRIDPWLTVWGMYLFSLPTLLPLLLIPGAIPPLRDGFWPTVIGGALLNTVAMFLYIHALRRSDLSLTIPMLAFSPLLLLLTSPLMIGETSSRTGMAGIVLIVVGSYVLNLRSRAAGAWAPFRAMLHTPGPRLMLMVAILWSIGANLDKMALTRASPLFYSIAVYTLMALFTAPAALFFALPRLRDIPRNYKILALLGTLNSFSLICQMTATAVTLVPYVIAVKRTNIVLGVLWGGLILREPGMTERLTGAAIMLAGVILITLA